MDTAQIALAVAAALLLLGAGAALGALLAQRRLRRGLAAAADSPPQDLAWPRAAYVAIVGVVSCALALGGAALYGRLGGSAAPDALKGSMFRADRPPAIAPGGAPVAGDLSPLLERLAAKLKAAPDDPDGWALLARGYVEVGRHVDAVPAFRMAVDKGRPDAQLLADFADTLAMTQDRKLAGEPTALVQRALAIDPHHPKALALAGSASFEAGDYARAIEHWQVLQSVLPPDSPDAANVANNIAEARAMAQGVAPSDTSLAAAIADKLATPATPALPGATGPAGARSATAPAAAAIGGTVRLAPGLVANIRPDDTLLVYAKSRTGSPAPLAIVRARAAELPFRFTLDESSAMVPGHSLAGASDVVVVARITRSGNAAPQPGDLQGSVDTRVGTRDVALAIGEVVP